MEYKIMGFDTEDNGKGDFVGGSIFDPQLDHVRSFHTRDAMRAYMESVDHAEDTLWIAHNAEYDIGNIWGIENLKNFELFLKSGDSFRIGKLSNNHTTIIDSYSHIQKPLSEIAKLVGMEKGRDAALDAPWSERREYCEMDSRIVGMLGYKLQEAYLALGTSLRASAGGSAIELFQRKFLHEEFPALKPNLWHYMNQGYYGGRTECFRISDYPGNDCFISDERGLKIPAIKGPWNYYDVNSLYPFEMKNRKFWHTGTLIFKKNPRPECLDYEGISNATVRVRNEYPTIPLRGMGLLLFPNGIFKGTWTNLLLRESKKYGMKILKIHSTCSATHSDYYLKEFVEKLYPLRERKTEFIGLAAKWLLNAISGKFGQKESTQSFRDGKLIMEKSPPPVYSNFWSSQITSGGYLTMRPYFGPECAMTDTDSVLTTATLPIGKDIGELKLEGTFPLIAVIRPKAYYCYDPASGKRIIHAKGVPVGQDKYAKIKKGDIPPLSPAEVYLMGKTAHFRRPTRLTTALKGKMKLNEWTAKTKSIKTAYTKRAVLPDGRTAPLEWLPEKKR